MKLVAYIAIVVFAATFGACKKKDNGPARQQLMVGTWNLNAYGQDDNMNGTLETPEYDTIPAGIALIQTYRSDGTGMFTTNAGSLSTSTNVTWVLMNNEMNLRVVTSEGDTTMAVVSKLTEHELQGYDPGADPRLVFLLTK